MRRRIVRGIYSIVKKIVFKIQSKEDKRNNTDFTTMIGVEDIGLDGAVHYEPTHIRIFGQLRRELGNVGPEDRILDVGCGKGMMLKFFSDFGFGRVDGLEYSEPIVEIAKKNMSTLGLNKCHIYCGDAREFDHYDDYNYIYMYNPFHEQIMEPCIDKIIESAKKNPRKIVLLYFNPKHADILLSKGFKEFEIKKSWFDRTWNKYIPDMRGFYYF